MYGSVALSIVFIVSIAGAFAISCPNSPAKWCETKEIAQACGVSARDVHHHLFILRFRSHNNVKPISGKFKVQMIK